MEWALLGILFAVCAALCAVGFYKFVYFLSIGYGFAVAGGGIAVLVMYCLAPTATPLWMGEYMRDHMPDAGLVVFEGGDHFAYLHQYDRFRVIARQFLG